LSKLKFKLVFVVSIILLSQAAVATDCNSNNLSMYEERICTSEKGRDSFEELKKKLQQLQLLIAKVYESAKSESGEASSSEVLAALEVSQRAWSEFAQKECDYIYQRNRDGNGTGAVQAAYKCSTDHNIARIKVIEKEIAELENFKNFSLTSVQAEQSLEEQVQYLEKMDKFASEAFETKFEPSIKGIKGLGKLVSETAKNYLGPHDDSPMVFKKFNFEGLTVEAHFKANDWNRAYVSRILISSSNWAIKHGLIVGTPKQEIVKRLGSTDNLNSNSMSYCGETDCVAFTLEQDKVKTIEITYYFD
jgi:uncharacterized protein YecT (DUF1311 family)